VSVSNISRKAEITEKYPQLKQVLDAFGNMNMTAYAAVLGGGGVVDSGYQDIISRHVGESFQSIPFLQTSPHLGFTLSDRMLTIIWLSHLATPINLPLYIGACGGVPFSNSARPGRIKVAGGSYNLVPSRFQDRLVATAQADVIDLSRCPDSDITQVLRKYRHKSVSVWMAQVLSFVLSTWLGREVIVFSLDHIAHTLLKQMMVEDPVWYENSNPSFLTEELRGRHCRISVSGSYTPPAKGTVSSWLMYSILAKISTIPLAGSFAFARYYPEYCRRWGLDLPYFVTTGVHSDLQGKTLWDIHREPVFPDKNAVVRDLLSNLV